MIRRPQQSASVTAAPPTPALLSTAAGECVGITDGRDGHSLFGKGLQPALAAIDAENQAATKIPGYVTVALLGPLTDGPNSLSGGRAVHQVEGAFIAQHRANQGNAYPKIRLVLANTGSEQKDWRTVTDRLKAMTSTKDRLVAVTGMGLSRQETIDAARALAKASIPMIGDLITAAGLDTTGTIDKGPKITGLVRVAPTVNTQLAAISWHLKNRPDLKTAALVSAPFTPNNTPDLYTQSLEKAFYDQATGLRPYLDRGDVYFNFDVRNGADRTSLNTISKNLCGRVTPDLVFYAGRATYLPTFLENLHQRQCRTTPISVVTGSDAATLDRKIPALNDPDAPISVLYVPLADPTQLSSKNNPDRALYKAFADEFGRPDRISTHDPKVVQLGTTGD
ncbi:ABC transporter substrate-binding protein [Streptomyces lavendofoliae]|uniref:ABC transporter substrate-binding protein n=1 Tax=Streptomyces lavendofoliae TaxID=67314 RepID=UPI003D8E33D9